MLTDPTHGVITHAKTERTKESIQRVGALYQQWVDGKKPDAKKWAAAAAAADADARREFYRQHGYWPSWRYYRGYGTSYQAGREHYMRMADKLIELLKSA